MKRLLFYVFITILVFNNTAKSQINTKFGFKTYLEKQPTTLTTFCVPNDIQTTALLHKHHITIKYSSKNWHFITTTAKWIDEYTKNGQLKNYYFEHAPPMALSDTALVLNNIKPVHLGLGGLQSPYTGKGVIIGYVDQGIDWNHPDFIDSNGHTRVLRYWDQSTNIGGTIPQPYNYGIVWDSAQINAGLCTSTEESSAHGSTVAGMGSSNARANGQAMGVAPNSMIIMIETNFNLNNWSLTVADACDYVFKVADSLGMQAVMNLSVGSYLGSHDGRDPAAEYMDSLVSAKSGRIIVCAAGNAGAKGKYHVTGFPTVDTSFVWIKNNTSTSAAFGANKIYFDLWSDTINANYEFAYEADLPAPFYTKRATTTFKSALANFPTNPIYDTLYNLAGQRIATIETYKEFMNGNVHIESYFSNVDSTNYIFRFKTKGSGSYDMWSGAWIGLNDFITTLPPISVVQDINQYNMPDTLQTLVSNWACSEKMITVANMRNRKTHTTKNNVVLTTDNTPVGKLSLNSSKGPTRLNALKPDITAAGDISLTAAPLWLLNNSAYNNSVDIDGWHARNGGTSMASPVVAGFAALYLEKCSKANYASFKNDIIATASGDNFTGVLPNYGYGNGKLNGLNALLMNEFTGSIQGPDSICSVATLQATASNPIGFVYWSDGSGGVNPEIYSGGAYSATIFNTKGCSFKTDTIQILQLTTNSIQPIVQNGQILITVAPNYQWTLNGVDLIGETNANLQITPPYGIYTCFTTSIDGCITETVPFEPFLGINELEMNQIILYPNPTEDNFSLHSTTDIKLDKITDVNGKEMEINELEQNYFSVTSYSKGVYTVFLTYNNKKIHLKLIRM